MSSESLDTVVIGGGQAGLAMGYYLGRAGGSFVILDAGARVGESWRNRWDSLRLFTPAKYDGLPGMPFPGADFSFPTKDETAEYLEQYARQFDLPVRLQTKVDSLARVDGHYEVTAGQRRFSAPRVVVATGAFHHPALPPYASQMRTSIAQMHSSSYRNPRQLPAGSVLVVGAANSGAEIAIEASAAGRRVWMSGRDPGRIPADNLGKLFGGRLYWWVLSRLLSDDTPVGRSVKRKSLLHGSPWIRLKPDDVRRANVERVARIAGLKDGMPLLEDGRVLEPSSVVWATGFRPGFDWIALPVFDEHGYPVHDRGVVRGAPGLYFLGLHFQHALNSALLGGVGADARYIADRIRADAEAADGKRQRRGRSTASMDSVQAAAATGV
jgi:putative flavoprotein involved in K+ transport